MRTFALTERDLETINASLAELRSLAVISFIALVVGILAMATAIAALVVAL